MFIRIRTFTFAFALAGLTVACFQPDSNAIYSHLGVECGLNAEMPSCGDNATDDQVREAYEAFAEAVVTSEDMEECLLKAECPTSCREEGCMSEWYQLVENCIEESISGHGQCGMDCIISMNSCGTDGENQCIETGYKACVGEYYSCLSGC